jgi:DNA-binding MarR family transcriptional regulator
MATRKPSSDSPTVYYRPEGYEPHESAAYLMKRILACVTAEVDKAFEPRGLTNAQWVPLFKLNRGDASTVAELARECQLDTGAMTRTLDRLEAKGLVTRERSSEDRRVVNIVLTKEGKQAAREIPAVLCKVQNAFLQGLSVAEWQQLKDLLARVLANGLALQDPSQGKE